MSQERKVTIYMSSCGSFREVWPNRSSELIPKTQPDALCTWDYETKNNEPKKSQHLLIIAGKQHIIPLQDGAFKPKDYQAIAAKALELLTDKQHIIIEAY